MATSGPPSTHTRAADPARRRIAGALGAGFKRQQVAHYVEQLLGALPRVIEAPKGVIEWRSALVGPARYPAGYRDAVILARGRLVPASVRQRHRDGNLRVNGVAEIRRALEAARAKTGLWDRDQRPLIPSVLVDATWLREAARRHEIPLSPELVRQILAELRRICEGTKKRFRRTLEPEVASLLREDDDLAQFHDWLSDHAISAEVRSRRLTARSALGPAALHLQREPAATRLDEGADPLELLATTLDAEPAALKTLLDRERCADRPAPELQRKAWALELMNAEMLGALGNDLDLAGGWAGRAMSFAAVSAEKRDERVQYARWLLERGRLRRFEPYHREFALWDYELGRAEFRDLVAAVVRYGILPFAMERYDATQKPPPSVDEMEAAVRKLAGIIASSRGIMAVEAARRRWRELGQWLPQNAAAASHLSRRRWPAIIQSFIDADVKIECITTDGELEEYALRFADQPTILYDVLTHGCHVLKLLDQDGNVVALTTLTHDELETAAKDGGIATEVGGLGRKALERKGWAVAPQWRRWMRVDVARLIHAVGTGAIACDLQKIRRDIDRRENAMRRIEAMPCGFDHRNREARKLVEEEIAPVLRLLIRSPKELASVLFDVSPNVDYDLDAAFLRGDGLPPTPKKKRAGKEATVSPLLRPGRHDVRSGAEGRVSLRALTDLGIAPPVNPEATRFLVIDIETTGLDATDRIIEIAAIELLGSQETGKSFHAYVQPGVPISKGAEETHGIADAMLHGRPTFAEIAPDFRNFIGTTDCWFVFHNADFDVRFIEAELQRSGLSFRIPPDRILCTMVVAEAFGAPGRSLDEVCQWLRIDTSARARHGALIDARLTMAVFQRLVFDRPVGRSKAAARRSKKTGPKHAAE